MSTAPGDHVGSFSPEELWAEEAIIHSCVCVTFISAEIKHVLLLTNEAFQNPLLNPLISQKCFSLHNSMLQHLWESLFQ